MAEKNRIMEAKNAKVRKIDGERNRYYANESVRLGYKYGETVLHARPNRESVKRAFLREQLAKYGMTLPKDREITMPEAHYRYDSFEREDAALEAKVLHRYSRSHVERMKVQWIAENPGMKWEDSAEYERLGAWRYEA